MSAFSKSLESNPKLFLVTPQIKALVQLRIDAGDVSLETHLQSYSKCASYMSKTTQNELLHCIGGVIQQEIVQEVHRQCVSTRSFYGIQTDEVTDVSNWEQLGIIVRYLKGAIPVERVLEFVNCETVSGISICKHIFQALRELTYSLSFAEHKLMTVQEIWLANSVNVQLAFKEKFLRLCIIIVLAMNST